MFGFGFTEMALIVLVAVMLFPARELPKIARGIAKLYGQVRRTADDFRASILEDEDLNAPIREIRTVYNEARYEVQRTREQTQREIAKARMEARMQARKLQAELGTGTGPTPQAGSEGAKAPAPAGSPAATTGARTTGASSDATPDPAADAASATPPEASKSAERAPREVLISATAGTNRREDAPPGRAPARSKLAVPPGLASGVRPAPGSVARDTPTRADATGSTTTTGSSTTPEVGSDAPEASASDPRASAEQGVA